MKTMKEKPELFCVIFLCSLIAFWLGSMANHLCISVLLAAGIHTALIFLYRYGIKPHIENRLSGTVYEHTQADCYITEDESEEID